MTERYVILPLMIKKTIAASFSVLLAVSVPLSASASEWQAMGARAMGMGGAGVADVQGPLASYWNPAALGRATANSYGLAIPVSAHVALTGTVVEGAKDLKSLNDTCSSGGTCTKSDIDAALSKLDDKNDGLRLNAAVGADFKVGKIGVFLNGFSDIGATPVVDHANDTQATIKFNTSGLIVKGANITEIGAGYGHELPFAPGVLVGGNLKLMNAQVGFAKYSIVNNSNNQNDITSTLKNGAKKSSNFGVDLAALWDVDHTFENARWQPRVGLVGRNLNNPHFKQADGAIAAGQTGRYAVNPQVRLGGAISPFNWWHLVSDIDLTRNLTPIDNIASRQFGVGTEVNVFNRSWINIPLRFGIARNLENAGAGTLLTGGVGINLLHFILDASAQVSPQSIQTQSQGKTTKIPREIALGVQLSVLFGGSDDRPSHAQRDTQTVPAEKAMEPAKGADQPAPAQVDQVKQNADKAQQDLNKESAQPAPTKP
jgi:hypothetical protein